MFETRGGEVNKDLTAGCCLLGGGRGAGGASARTLDQGRNVACRAAAPLKQPAELQDAPLFHPIHQYYIYKSNLNDIPTLLQTFVKTQGFLR